MAETSMYYDFGDSRHWVVKGHLVHLELPVPPGHLVQLVLLGLPVPSVLLALPAPPGLLG